VPNQRRVSLPVLSLSDRRHQRRLRAKGGVFAFAPTVNTETDFITELTEYLRRKRVDHLGHCTATNVGVIIGQHIYSMLDLQESCSTGHHKHITKVSVTPNHQYRYNIIGPYKFHVYRSGNAAHKFLVCNSHNLFLQLFPHRWQTMTFTFWLGRSF